MGQSEARWNAAIVSHSVPTAEKSPQGNKTQLALAIAHGISVDKWARKHNVPRTTAFRWAREQKVRAAVEFYRRRALDRAVGRMARHVDRAAGGIAKLAKDAVSESVKLAALRAIFSNMMAVSEFTGLEARMAQF